MRLTRFAYTPLHTPCVTVKLVKLDNAKRKEKPLIRLGFPLSINNQSIVSFLLKLLRGNRGDFLSENRSLQFKRLQSQPAPISQHKPPVGGKVDFLMIRRRTFLLHHKAQSTSASTIFNNSRAEPTREGKLPLPFYTVGGGDNRTPCTKVESREHANKLLVICKQEYHQSTHNIQSIHTLVRLNQKKTPNCTQGPQES